MKTYTTGRIIDILKPGQKAQSHDKRHDTEIYKDDAEAICFSYTNETVRLNDVLMTTMWKLVPQYVTFDEAVKAYKEGKVIMWEGDGAKLRLRFDPSEVTKQPYFTFHNVANGKWAIVAEDAE